MHVPNFKMLCNAKDPPWITKNAKCDIRCEHRMYKEYVKNRRRPEDWKNVKAIRNDTTRKIEQTKEDFFRGIGQRLRDPLKGQKAYWETIK